MGFNPDGSRLHMMLPLAALMIPELKTAEAQGQSH